MTALYQGITKLFLLLNGGYHRASNLVFRFDACVSRALYRAGGKNAWSLGYASARRRSVIEILNDKSFHSDRLPSGYGAGFDERIVEYPWLFERLPRGKGHLLDAGSVLNFDYILNREALKEKELVLVTLVPESECHWWKKVSYVYEDLRKLSFRDQAFDFIVSLSTLEHVGMNNSLHYTQEAGRPEIKSDDYLVAVRELARTLKRGGQAFISVPFGKRADYEWLQLFDAAMVDRMIEAFSPASVKQTYFRYFPDGWKEVSREACADAAYYDHRKNIPNPKGVAAAEAVACIEITTFG